MPQLLRDFKSLFTPPCLAHMECVNMSSYWFTHPYVYTLCKWHCTILEHITCTHTHTHTHKHTVTHMATLCSIRCTAQEATDSILNFCTLLSYSLWSSSGLLLVVFSKSILFPSVTVHSSSSTLRCTCKSVWESGNSRIMKLLLAC